MDASDFVVPEDQLPRGIAERIDDPPSNPAPARPAATVVLIRDADEGVEVLLLKRVYSAGFVPGAYVFPGGRVDAEDAYPVVLSRTASLTMEGAAQRMGLRDASPPAAAYYLTALREAFARSGTASWMRHAPSRRLWRISMRSSTTRSWSTSATGSLR